ncbi:glycosyl transferase [Tritrichomonas foetus]|uniref:UDP-N-acetylglucosamine transferase subunit ALG13 n=1 Tax=Tritrichomonas foetus TaxID=1144522 RepID=A0A1J4JQQ9_9EUKA|nr:glycosyl transferase [Tritrichomonas foetus]|eukprot:OHT01503.1 glycosyl transferase [Tritrichomonas foetus]
MSKKIVVTVGSTHFDALIKIIDSKEFIELAKSKGYGHITAQIGAYEGEIKNLTDFFKYAPPTELNKHFREADLVVGHAGAGTITEVLQLGKPLIVVVNDLLMENHQTEVAREFHKRGLLEMATTKDFVKIFETKTFEPHQITLSADDFVKKIDAHFNFKLQ